MSVKTSDLDALAVAHDLLARDLTGFERAKELVRQAEARVKAGAPQLEALQHGEAGLTSVPPSDAEELLVRLAAIAEKPGEVVDLYERQVTRCKAPANRVRALARAAQVAATRVQLDRARGFFNLALSGAPTDETLTVLEQAAREGDTQTTGERLRRALCAAMAASGQGSRDGGRTRGAMMRRAASMAHRDLDDLELAFAWLGDALIAYVDPLTLDSLEGLAQEVGDPRRAEATLSRALGEVFDGPMVRQLYARRARLRREQLDDKPGAAADLKKLHDVAPSDQGVMDELSALLTELGDYRGMVQLYEDHILRGKDMAARAELARKVARMWEEQLADPREAADAWRRVLRMKPADPEATQGLERAKSNMLKKPEPGAEQEAYAPPKLPQVAPPEPSSPANATQEAETPEPGEALERAVTERPARPLGLAFPGSDETTKSTPAELPSPGEAEVSDDDAVADVSDEVDAGNDHLAPVADHNADYSSTNPNTDPPDPAGETINTPRAALSDGVEEEFGEEVVIADDLAEMIDVDEVNPSTTLVAAPEATPVPEKAEKHEKRDGKKRKRSIPPPVPREG